MNIPEKLLCFDIETSEQAQDDKISPITVASTVTSDSDKRAWFSLVEDSDFVGITGKQKGETWAMPAKGTPAQLMSKGTALAMLKYMDEKRKQGYSICAWNGAGFDLKMIGHLAGNVELAGEIALELIDPMFQVLTVKGYPVGLSAVQKGLGITQEKSMAGKDAPEAWKNGEFQKVTYYVVGDSEITLQAIIAIAKVGGINWTAKSGKSNSMRFERFKTVGECLLDPEPNNSWMDKPIDRRKIVAWVPAKLMTKYAKQAISQQTPKAVVPAASKPVSDATKWGKPVLIVVSGPSGAGKSVLCEEVMRTMPTIKRSVTVTTRQPREGEVDGVDYRFVSVEQFDKMVASNDFFEHAEVHGNKYGSSKADVSARLADGQDVVMILDVQGAKVIRDFFAAIPVEKMTKFRVADVFILPPSMDELKKRLVTRGKDDAAAIDKRMANAPKEVEQAKFYKYSFVNDDLNKAWNRLQSIFVAEKCSNATRFGK